MKIWLCVVAILATMGCKKVEVDPYPFVNGKQSKLTMKYEQDINGYYLVPIDSNSNSNRVDLYVEASELIDHYKYNGVSVIEAEFDCSSYWVLGILGSDLGIILPLYQPFGSYRFPSGKPIAVADTMMPLDQFKNSMVPMVTKYGIYLKEYFDGDMYKPADEYKPEPGMLWSKKIAGPIPGYFVGDTIFVYSKIFWDCSNWSVTHPKQTFQTNSIKIIFKSKP